MIVEITRTKFVLLILYSMTMAVYLHVDHTYIRAAVQAEVQTLRDVHSDDKCYFLTLPENW